MGSLSKRFLDNLLVGEREMVIVDTEAGIEHFGRGIEAGCDTILAVFDPSYESLLLSRKIGEILEAENGNGLVFRRRTKSAMIWWPKSESS